MQKSRCFCSIVLAFCGASLAEPWPQLARTPQRTGYTPEQIFPPALPFTNLWVKDFRLLEPPQRVASTAQLVSDGKLAWFGTMMGNFYAVEAMTGNTAWEFKARGPIMHTAGFENDKVFFACMRSCVYALERNTGRQMWRFESGGRLGFRNAVLLAEGNVYIGDNNGIFYAISQADGSLLWKRDMGSPIYHSAAYNDGRVFFSCMDLYTYALDAKTGCPAWKSSTPATGTGVMNYYPVVWKNRVVVVPRKPYDIYAHTCERDKPEAFHFPFYEFKYRDDPNNAINGDPGAIKEFLSEHRSDIDGTGFKSEIFIAPQDKIIQAFEEHPHRKIFYVYNEATGVEEKSWPVLFICLSGETRPPCVDRDGLLVVPVHFYAASWARLDPGTGKLVDVLCDLEQFLKTGEYAGCGNPDENSMTICAGRTILLHHANPTGVGGAHYRGNFDLDARRWTEWAASWAKNRDNTQLPVMSYSIAAGILFYNSKDYISATWVGGPR